MAEGFDADSPQGFLMYSTTAAAGTLISLEDADGRELLSEEIPCGFSSVVLSTPELKVGDMCTITIDGVQEQITIDNSSSSGFGRNGMFRGGMPNGRNRDGMTNEQDIPVMGMIESPDDSVHFDDGEVPGDMAPPDRTEIPDRMDMPDDERVTDREGMKEGGGRPFAPDAEQDQGNGTHSRQQDRGQMHSEEDISASGISAAALVGLVISVLVLLIGLCIAVKIKY